MDPETTGDNAEPQESAKVEGQETKEVPESKEAQESKEVPENKEVKESKEVPDSTERKESIKVPKSRSKDAQETIEVAESKEGQEPKEASEPGEGVAAKEAPKTKKLSKEVPKTKKVSKEGQRSSKDTQKSKETAKSKGKGGKKKISLEEPKKTSKDSETQETTARRSVLLSKDNTEDVARASKLSRLSRMESSRPSVGAKQRPPSKSVTVASHSSLLSAASSISLDLDVVTLTVPETTQKIVHCHVGTDLFVDKTWCLVKKADLLEDIAIEDANSPFVPLTTKILDYKEEELLIGYEPFASEPNQFMLCVTTQGRDEVLNRLEEMKNSYLQRIQQSKAVVAKKWESLGSEEFVDQFQIKNTRKLISMEWIGDITKRSQHPRFEDCDPDDMKNGYTCLVPSEKEKFELVYKKTQETGVQAVASKAEVEVQTEPEIPTNASTQYAPETEITVPDSAATQAAIASADLGEFFQKYTDYLTQCLEYNEVYDLYHDDYPALYVQGEETQVQQLGTYHQYQSFTDVAAIEGKLVISSSWHPNYTGVVAIAYADEIPCLMKELEFDSDQTDYEEERTDEEGEGVEEPELGAGARDWLEEERRERESAGENTELYERAVRRLREIEAAKVVWDAKIQEQTEEIRKLTEETLEENVFANLLQYREYQEPEPEPELEPQAEDAELPEGSATSRLGVEGEGEEEEGYEGEGEEEGYEGEGEEEEGYEGEGEEGEEGEEGGEGEALAVERGTKGATPTSSKISSRQQLEADVEESEQIEPEQSAASVLDELFQDDRESLPSVLHGRTTTAAHSTVESRQPSLSIKVSRSTMGSVSSTRKTHHRKKKKLATIGKSVSRMKQTELESITSKSSMDDSTSLESKIVDLGKEKDLYPESEFFDEVTDEEEIKEKQDELPLLEVNNPVLIWSFVDDLTPKLRLDSPYEVRVVAFSRHNGNLVAGGTASGQVVVWDITGRIEELERPENLTHNQQMFRKRMEDLMSWRRDIRSKRRVRFTAVSNQKESHMEKITELIWVTPSLLVTDGLELVKNPFTDYNLQLVSCSIAGELFAWDLKTDPAKGEYRRAPMIFKTKERFGRPPTLDMGVSQFHKLHRIWKPFTKMHVHYRNMPVALTGFSIAAGFAGRYVRANPKPPGVKELLEDRIEFKAVFPEIEGEIPHHMYFSNLSGQAGTFIWDPNDLKNPDNLANVVNVHHFWDSYHDRPITRLCRHPFMPSLCLTVGGHVFAVWHIENKEEPILVKRYYGAYLTDAAWSGLRPSLIRIARSDGVVEIWDLIIQNHAPATTIIVSGRVITNLSSPLLPEVRGLLGVADYNSAFCLFFIPQQFRVWTESELSRLSKFLSREPERRRKMKEWSKWWRENNVNVDREERRQAEEKKKLDEEVRLEKEKQEEAKKKYNEEVYKWYMRRRGKSFLWAEEADDKWREKQEEHMQEMVMAKKKIDRAEMEVLMRPIVKEEKNEALKHAKAQERLRLADTIFRQTVELIFPKAAKQVEASTGDEESLSEQIDKLVEYYFGENFDTLADEQCDFIDRSPWQFEFEWSELLDKYNALRMLFNDRRRKRSKTLRWLRKKLREELMREGRKVHVRKSHMARYPKRKIQRRQENLEWLQNTYGDDYNIYWDKHQPCRRFIDRKFRYAPLEEVDSLLFGEGSEPEVEEEEPPRVPSDGKVLSSLEMITQVGIEHIPEETFAADLDTALLTLESRTSLGVKSIPSFEKPVTVVSRPTSTRMEVMSTARSTRMDVTSTARSSPTSHLTLPGTQSPQDASDISAEEELPDETPSLIDNQLQELDYIQQPVGTKINTLQTKKAHTTAKREISHGVKIKFEESVSDDFVIDQASSTEMEGEEGEEDEEYVPEGEEGGEEEEGEEGEEGEDGEGEEEEMGDEGTTQEKEIPEGEDQV